MSKRTHESKGTGGRHTLRASIVHEDSRTQRSRTRGDAERTALLEGLDDLLNDIDDVLEENAEEFVKSYVQKGGQ